jgi:hypothetical protein
MLADGDAVGLAPRIARVEEAELDGRRVLAEEGEVDARPSQVAPSG